MKWARPEIRQTVGHAILRLHPPTQKASAAAGSAAVVPRIGSRRATAKAYAGPFNFTGQGVTPVLIRHEPWVEELSVQLQFEELITETGLCCSRCLRRPPISWTGWAISGLSADAVRRLAASDWRLPRQP